MGYTHYWYREKEIAPPIFARITTDFKTLLPVLKVLDIRLGNGSGEGKPVINNCEVVFNGLRNCGHPKNASIVIPWPSPTIKPGVAPNASEAVVGSWYAGVYLNQRTCNGDCSYETFYFPRVLSREVPVHDGRFAGKYFQFCKTGFRPYDLAVTAFLVIAKHHLGNRLIVKSDGTIMHWMDAVKLCQDVLGYGLDFELGE